MCNAGEVSVEFRASVQRDATWIDRLWRIISLILHVTNNTRHVAASRDMKRAKIKRARCFAGPALRPFKYSRSWSGPNNGADHIFHRCRGCRGGRFEVRTISSAPTKQRKSLNAPKCSLDSSSRVFVHRMHAHLHFSLGADSGSPGKSKTLFGIVFGAAVDRA